MVESHVDAFTIRRVVESTFQPGVIVPESNFNQKEESFKVIEISNINNGNNVTSSETNNTKQIVSNIEEEHNKATEKIDTTKNITDTPETKATEKILNITNNDATVATLSSNYTTSAASLSTTQAEKETERDDKEALAVTESVSETTATEGKTSISSSLEDDFITTISSKAEDDAMSTANSILEDNSVSSESPNFSESSVTGIEENVTKSGEKYTKINYNISSISSEENSTQRDETITTEVDNYSYVTVTTVTETPTTTELVISSKEVDNYTDKENTTASSPKSVLGNLVNKDLKPTTEQDTITEQNSAERENTELSTDYSTESLIPYWKKYTQIDRKRFNSTEQPANSSSSLETLVHAESGLTLPTIFPSLENTFSTSKVASLDKLTHEQSSSTSELPADMPTSPGTDFVITLSPVETTQPDITETFSVLPRLDVVSSLRAGYLDYSSRFTEEPETTAFEEKILTTTTEANVVNLIEKMSTTVNITEFSSNKPSLATTPEPTTSLLELGSSISNQETTTESVNQINITQGVIELASQRQMVRSFITGK